MPFKYDRKAILKDLLEGKLTKKEIVVKYKISPTLIWHILVQNGIIKKYTKPCYTLTKEFLEEHYVKLKKNASEIAREFGFKSGHVVGDALKRYGFKTKVNGKSKRDRDNKNFKNWKGYGEVSGTMICELRNRSKRRGLDFDLTAEFLWRLYLEQNKKCALSGEDIEFRQIENRLKRTQSASLDRIDSKKGYVKDNVQWVHVDVQWMKWSHDETLFVDWCIKIAKNKMKQRKNK